MISRNTFSIKTLLIFFLASNCVSTYAQEGMVGYFPFNGDADDQSEINIDGTMNNMESTIGINDSIDSAFYFNGTDANVYCGIDDRKITDSISISAWVKTTMVDNGFLITKYNYNEDKGFHLSINEGYLRLGGRNNSGTYTNTGPSSKLINDGEWHHVFGFIHGNSWEIWIDCELDTKVNSTALAPSLNNTEPLTIGNFNLEANRYFKGSMDEVKIYNRALTALEIENLCKGTVVSAQDPSLAKSGVTFFPNPSQGLLSFTSEDFVVDKIEIYNAQGLKVLEFASASQHIDISKLANGIYSIRSYDANKNKSIATKIIKID